MKGPVCSIPEKKMKNSAGTYKNAYSFAPARILWKETTGKLEDIVMEQTIHAARSGWSQEETDLLWKEIRSAADTGAPLREVFERMGETLGRKPNSVRNYYYMQLRDQPGEGLRRASPFENFTPEEIHRLLRHVLQDRGRGVSVRASVMDLSGGDKTRMLRYQNKYRAILRKKPALIDSVMEELRSEGLPCPDARPAASQGLNQSVSIPQAVADPDVQRILEALSSLATRAQKGDPGPGDRLRVQRDLLSMRLEDLQLAVKALIGECKEFLGLPPETRPASLPDFCAGLSGHIAKLETLSD